MIKVKYQDGISTVVVKRTDLDEQLSLEGFIDEIIHPLLLGLGYSPKLVERVMIIDEEERCQD